MLPTSRSSSPSPLASRISRLVGAPDVQVVDSTGVPLLTVKALPLRERLSLSVGHAAQRWCGALADLSATCREWADSYWFD